MQQVADSDVALGMVVQHIMQSRAYYDPKTGEGSTFIITYDDAQSTLDHIHPHRTPLIVASPYAKAGYVAKYTTASIVKTEELLLGLPPNNLESEKTRGRLKAKLELHVHDGKIASCRHSNPSFIS